MNESSDIINDSDMPTVKEVSKFMSDYFVP